MNIFYLHHDPLICAKMHCDKHVVKMILEYSMMLSTAHHECDGVPSIDCYKSAYKMFTNNVFVGVGPNMFRFECNNSKYYEPNGCSTHPHNTYLQLLAETGIIGAAPIIFSFLFVCFLFFLSCRIPACILG